MPRKPISPAEFIEILKMANGEELAEIRRLLGVPMWYPVAQPYVVPAPTAPAPAPVPNYPWPLIPCGSGHVQ